METISIVYHDAWHLFSFLLLAHLLGDFLLQPKKLVAWKMRSKWGALAHVGILFAINIMLIFPYLFMLSEKINMLYMWLGLIIVYALHFMIDTSKIVFTRAHPRLKIPAYFLDQGLHITLLALLAFFMKSHLGVAFNNEFLAEMYFAKDLVLYFVVLILVTYVWEVTLYTLKPHKKRDFEPRMKLMMLRGITISLICTILMLFAPTTYASTNYATNITSPDGIIFSVDPQVFVFGDEIAINGRGFGDEMDKYSQVCWGNYCINKDSILTWEDEKITFKMNVLGMPSQGILHVIQLHSSELYTEDIEGEMVTVLPKINKFFDSQGNELGSLTAGQLVTITGYYFGNTPSIIKLDSFLVREIDSWANEEITFEVPDMSTETNAFYLERKNSSSTTVDIKGATGLSSDEFSHLQTYLFNTNTGKAWTKYGARGAGVVVAVLDDGVNISHPDLVGSIWQNPGEVAGDGIDNDNNGLVDDYNGYDFVEKSPNLQPHGDHGTLVSGVIAATANNRMGIAGIAPEAKIMPLTVCESKTCSGQAVIDAIRYAVDNGADIINLSLTGLGDNPTFDATFDASMWYAHDHGVIVVVAAGNGNQSLSKAQKFYGRNFNMSPISPVCNDGTGNWVIGVASLDNSSLNSVFSDYGSNCIDISAYGEGVFSTGVKEFSDDNSEYDSAYGTSFATPQISGALALAISQFPGKSMTDIKSALIKSGTNIDPNLALEFKGHFGKALNILSFLDMLAITETTPTTPTSNPANPSNDTSSSTTNPNSQTGFSDLGAIHRSYTAITYLTNKNILEGYPDGTFKPSATVNRAELLKILVAGQDIDPDPIRYRNCFPDVKEEWFARYVCYAKSQGWVEGYDDGTFRPAETVNKVEALKMMIEGLDITFSEDYTARFADTPSNAWFAPYVALAQHLNLLEERGALFNPASDRTRSSISENLYRLLQIRERGLESYEG